MIEILDRLPVATLLAVAAVVGGLIALVTGEITYAELLEKLGFVLGGTGVLGIARTQAGKGKK